MSLAPSFTLDVETAVAFRDWLFETGVENHAEPQIADPLAELAAAIDSELHDSTESVSISASTTAVSPTGQSTVVDEVGSPAQQEFEDSTPPADGFPVDDADIDANRLNGRLADDRWDSPLDQQNAAQDNTPTAHGQSTSSTETSPTPEERNRMPVRYLTAYECSVCDNIREVETSLQVCAFVDDCEACGAIDVRFTAVGIPKPLQEQ
jgi:hypothetical protein